MKLNSKYFDSIRVASKRERSEPVREERHPRCQWKGCKSTGDHRAPRGRGQDGQYYLFCMEHVRQYNAAYNYFDGMNDSQVQDFQKDAMTGHRPTWKVGVNAKAPGARAPRAAAAERCCRLCLPDAGSARLFRAACKGSARAAGREPPAAKAARKEEPPDAQPVGRSDARRDQGPVQGAGKDLPSRRERRRRALRRQVARDNPSL